MQKFLILLLSIMMLSLVGCGGSEAANTPTVNKDSRVKAPPIVEVEEAPVKELSITDFETLFKKQDVYVTKTEFITRNPEYPALYPDGLSAVVKSNTKKDIKDVVVAFVGWDENNLPMKFKMPVDISGGSYVVECLYNDINLVQGKTFGEGFGLSLAETPPVERIKAIVKSYESFDGTSWENPYFPAWEKAFSGVKYNKNITVPFEE